MTMFLEALVEDRVSGSKGFEETATEVATGEAEDAGCGNCRVEVESWTAPRRASVAAA